MGKKQKNPGKTKKQCDSATKITQWTVPGLITLSISVISLLVSAGGLYLHYVFGRNQTHTWVGLDSEQPDLRNGQIRFDKGSNAHSTVTLIAKNFGNYPAQKVFIGHELFIAGDMNLVHHRQREICNEGVPDNLGAVLLPGTKTAWNWPGMVAKEQMAKLGGDDNQLLAFIIGCVFYVDQMDVPHRTGFSFRLHQPHSIAGAAFKPAPNLVVQGDWVLDSGTID